MGYSDPNFTVRREDCGAAGGAATTEYNKFATFQKKRLKKVHALVTLAGTATAHKFDVYHGTTSIGTIALSTSTAGSVGHSGLLDRTVDTMEQISVKSGADAVGTALIVYEYEVTPDAVLS